MATPLILETTFLVDLEREAHATAVGPPAQAGRTTAVGPPAQAGRTAARGAPAEAGPTTPPRPAHAFLDAHPDRGLAITLTTAGELACGPDDSQRAHWEGLVSRFRLLEPDRETAWRYGSLYRFLRRNGTLIGANDLWIAATALTHRAPLVTRNLRDFRRIPELEVLGY